eukprot:TRINITY_DN4784_c0_g1_i10.p2 TRINITY_DN4784_c0_g1~~TRINITY_DN4784_c0_g1_i10.p2  ORF type:complete len:364 (-),score=35.03 TRINITY_DN4784_c0_g1_i10:1378-2370(-)
MDDIVVFTSYSEFQLHANPDSQNKPSGTEIVNQQQKLKEIEQVLNIEENEQDRQCVRELVKQGDSYLVQPCEYKELEVQYLTYVCVVVKEEEQAKENVYIRGWNIPLTLGKCLIINKDEFNLGSIEQPWVDSTGMDWLTSSQDEWINSGDEKIILRLIGELLRVKGLDGAANVVAEVTSRYPQLRRSPQLQKIIHEHVASYLEEQNEASKGVRGLTPDLDSAASENIGLDFDTEIGTLLENKHNIFFSKAYMPQYSLKLAVETASRALELYCDDDEQITMYICDVFDKRYSRRSWHCITGSHFHWKGQFQTNHLVDFSIDGRRFVIFSTI